MVAGRVVAIYVGTTAGQPLCSVDSVTAFADRGLEGDRYSVRAGSFSRWPGSGRAVTFIEIEVLGTIKRDQGVDLLSGQHRRNVVVQGVSLKELNGRRFTIGGATFRGARLCEPCRYLERLVGGPVFDALKGRGGLRADVLEGGLISVQDHIVPLGPAARLP